MKKESINNIFKIEFLQKIPGKFKVETLILHETERVFKNAGCESDLCSAWLHKSDCWMGLN